MNRDQGAMEEKIIYLERELAKLTKVFENFKA
jgi:hypothetical protein